MSEDKDTGGPAFPADRTYKNAWQDGMTLRDYFAAKAMQGLMHEDINCTKTALLAYQQADAMIQARKK